MVVAKFVVCRFSFVTFLLTVTDVNDNCPQFMGTESSTNNSFMAAVSEVRIIYIKAPAEIEFCTCVYIV